MRPLRHLDLFAGIGGFSLGLERTGGFETVAFCECDKEASAVLHKNWPAAPVFPDVAGLSAEEVGEVDIITGGFPCQDVSYARTGSGLGLGLALRGERSGSGWPFAVNARACGRNISA